MQGVDELHKGYDGLYSRGLWINQEKALTVNWLYLTDNSLNPERKKTSIHKTHP